MKLSHLDRVLLLATSLVAAYQVVVGIEGLATMAIACYTIAFGVLIIASLLMLILGFEVLDSSVVVIASTLIPTSLALGLVSQFQSEILIPYGISIVIGFIAIVITRYTGPKKLAVIILALVHGLAGVTIFFLPFILALREDTPTGFALVGVGGMLISLGGLLLSFLKTGKPLLSREKILTIFPGLLLLVTLAFVVGFTFV